MNIFLNVLDWSEVWAVLLPLGMVLYRSQQPRFMKPLIGYLLFALLINLTGNVMADFKEALPIWMHSNTPLYNIHSLVRFLSFCAFFLLIPQNYFKNIRYILILIYVLLVSLNFFLVEDFMNPHHISGSLLTIEAYVLLIFCMMYYLSQLRDEISKFRGEQEFWVVVGLSLFVVSNFFVFLFYVPMITENPDLADRMWDVHNMSYVIMCLFLTKALYVPVRTDN